MLGSVDCIHWSWKTCPFYLASIVKMASWKLPSGTLKLDGLWPMDLPWSFGMVGSHNDANVLQWQPVFARLVEGHVSPRNSEINGHQYTKGYYLTDGIYPRWLTFLNITSEPLGHKKSHVVLRQKSCIKHVALVFGATSSIFYC
jgi:hypothetical protein